MTGKKVRMLWLPHFPTYLLRSSSYFEIGKTNNKVLSWIQIIIRKSNTKEILNFFQSWNQVESMYISKLLETIVTVMEGLNEAYLT